MHNNYYFLKQLSRALEGVLSKTVISEVFSQNKDELVLRFETTGKSFYIKANLSPAFSCLSFPDDFQRARKNSIDLFGELIGQRVLGVRQFENERSFALNLTNDFTLLFKMHGNRSNIVLFEKEEVKSLFKNNLPADVSIKLDPLDRTIDWSYEQFLKGKENPGAIYFTFGKAVWKFLEEKNFSALSSEQQWQLIRQTRETLESTRDIYVTSYHNALSLTLLPVGEIRKRYDDPIRAITDFYYAYVQQQALLQEKASMVTSIKSKIEGSKSYIDKNQSKLNEIESDHNYKIWADLIMANLHTIKQGEEKVQVANLYNDNHPIDIKLKKELSPQKNAAAYYRKAKNQHIEIQRLSDTLKAKHDEIEKLSVLLSQVITAEDLKTLRALTGKQVHKHERSSTPVPYHEFEFKGYKIWVGKDAARNDELTLKYSYKEDLWLHAKDVAGSHVLIKYQSGKNFPKDVIERAAQLAAFNSKRKNETLCPVSVTQKKFVRKRKGDLAGAVVVEREEVILVEPKN